MKNIPLIVSWMFAIFLFTYSHLSASDWEQRSGGRFAIFPMEAAPYPDISRADGYQRKDDFYPAEVHYSDSSVAIFIPAAFSPGKGVNLLFYFHGHGNNIKKAIDQFSLLEMVAESDKNLIFVFPQGPKNSRDSGCGKLETEGGLSRLAGEVLGTLASGGIIDDMKIGKIILAGHSGAYKVIGQILKQGGLTDKIAEVYLLDATYGQLEIFESWAAGHRKVLLRSIFTDHLAPENVTLMKNFSIRNVKYKLLPEEKAGQADLKNRILFLHAVNLDHGGTVSWLGKFLEGSRIR